MKAITLIELLIVTIIIIIIAGIAIPNFSKAKERAVGKEAIASLKLIAAAERIYNMEKSAYYFSSVITDINTNLKLFLLATSNRNWDYSITNAATFTAIADRTSGPYSGCIYSLTYADYTTGDGEPDPNGSCP